MQFSFHKTKAKPKQNARINLCKHVNALDLNLNETKMSETNETIIRTDSDPCAVFKHHYQIAVTSAEQNNFIESLRAFDIAIRFWGIYLERLRNEYPMHYKRFKFVDVRACNASQYFLNLYKQNKDSKRKKTKKKLWKPPPNNQRNDSEIIYFDNSGNSDSDIDIDIMTENDSSEMRVREWEKSLLIHRKIGSEMYEYQSQVLLEMDRDFEAIKAVQSAILLNEMSEINWLTLSRAELNFGDPFQSLLSVSRAIELNYESDAIIEHYSRVYGICNKLTEMRAKGMVSGDVLKRRLVSVKQCCDNAQKEVSLVKERLGKRGDSNNYIGRLDRKSDTQHIIDNYQKKKKMD